MTSSGPTRSSTPSITKPIGEYSRMELVSRMQASLVINGPARLKAIIFKVSGSIMGVEMKPTGEPVWTLKTGVLISLVLVTNISLL